MLKIFYLFYLLSSCRQQDDRPEAMGSDSINKDFVKMEQKHVMLNFGMREYK